MDSQLILSRNGLYENGGGILQHFYDVVHIIKMLKLLEGDLNLRYVILKVSLVS